MEGFEIGPEDLKKMLFREKPMKRGKKIAVLSKAEADEKLQIEKKIDELNVKYQQLKLFSQEVDLMMNKWWAMIRDHHNCPLIDHLQHDPETHEIFEMIEQDDHSS